MRRLVVIAVGLLTAALALSNSVEAARAVLAPPSARFVPARHGTKGAPCRGRVRCVGPNARYRTIGAAVAAARNGDTIQVQAGRYRERVRVVGKRLTLHGGFAAGFARSRPAANRTVIDGEGHGSTVVLEMAGNSVVDGFTVTGGRAPLGEDGAHGSGIRVSDSGRVTVSNNLIVGNDDRHDFRTCNCASLGGGIDAGSYLRGSSITVRGNIIRRNRAHRGGGVAIGIPALIVDNLVENNRGGGDHGGGIYLNATRMTIRHNLIRGNRVGDQAGYGWGGGGIFYGPGNPTPRATFEANRWVGNRAPSAGSGLFIDDDARARIVGDLFHDNACGVSGGAALYVDGGGDPPRGSEATLENVTMTHHRCPRDRRGSAIFTEGGSRISVTNSIITGNGGASQILVCTDCADDVPRLAPSTIAWSLVGGATTNVRHGRGMRRGSPGFVRPRARDFHLARRSRAIDAANPASSVGLEPRPNGGRRNMGAYGGSREATRSR